MNYLKRLKQMMIDEYGNASNIKMRVCRQPILTILQEAIRKLKELEDELNNEPETKLGDFKSFE